MRTWISRDCHPLLPVTTTKSSFFHQFSLGSIHRVFPLLHHSSAKFVHRLSYRITILSNKHKLSVLRNGNGIHPIRIFQHIIFVNDNPCWQLHLINTRREPRLLYQIFLRERLPFHIFICHIFHSLNNDTSIQLHTSPTKLSDYFSKQPFIFNWDINNNAFLT